MTPAERAETFTKLRAVADEGDDLPQIHLMINVFEHICVLLERIANKRGYGDVD